jgi:hypothetical protein
MATNESNESRYQSAYGGNWVTPAQRIAEIMCERLAKQKKIDLPVKFWNLPAWKRTFMQQILAANSLLKVYKPKSILTALKREPKAYSLRAAWLIAVIKEEEDKQERIEKVEETPSTPVLSTTEQPRVSFSPTKSKLSKLRELG